MLEAREIDVRFGGVKAVNQVTLQLERREILGLIGPNGAGKTTLVNAISGFQRPGGGSVVLEGRTMKRWQPPRPARCGVVRTFQAVRLFPAFTVLEQLEVGLLGSGVRRGEARRRASNLASTFDLDRWTNVAAASLPHGIERRVGIVRALAADPDYLFLDEPAAGLDEAESRDFRVFLRQLRDTFECGVCVIEHDMQVIMSSCERIHVLDAGRTLAIGTPAAIRADPRVVEAYLGTSS